MTPPTPSTPVDQPPRALRLATIGGVPVYLGWSWLLLAGVVVVLVGPGLAQRWGVAGYGLAGLYAVGLLVCVLAHEAAHAVVARRLGHPVLRVVADLWGGHTAFDASTSTPRTAALIALAGPGANLALAALAWGIGLLPVPAVVAGVLGLFAVVNVLLAALNLLPGLPLDGGQALEAGVWAATGDQGRGRLVAGWTGRVLAVLLVAAVVLPGVLAGVPPRLTAVIWGALVAAFLWSGASGAIASGRFLRSLGSIDLDTLLEPAVALDAGQMLTSLTGIQGVPVVLEDARPRGLLDLAALRSVPPEAVGTTPLRAVLAPRPAGWVAELGGSTPLVTVVHAFQSSGSDVVVVLDGGRLVGVVRAARLDAALHRAGVRS